MRKIYLAILVLLFASCSLFNPITPPDVQLTNILVRDVSIFETSLDATIRIDNLANQPLEFSGSTHKLYINGTELGVGRNYDPTSIPALGSTTKTIRFNISNLSFLNNVRHLVDSNHFEYRIDSELFRSAGGLLGTVKVTKEGRFDP